MKEYILYENELPVDLASLCKHRARQEIVRCRDCEYCVKETNGDLYCDILAIGYEPLGSKNVTDDWFCADGIRKDGGK